ncbi:hypothetical protein HK405_011481 [Cladochytrium tenue]|nr:hypothetical protein HK405_011481 [Cladochytrium tenue]
MPQAAGAGGFDADVAPVAGRLNSDRLPRVDITGDLSDEVLSLLRTAALPQLHSIYIDAFKTCSGTIRHSAQQLDGTGDPDAEMPRLAARQFYSSAAIGRERKLRLYSEAWGGDSYEPDIDESPGEGSFGLEPKPGVLWNSDWDALQYRLTPEEDMRYSLNTHSGPSDAVWGDEHNICTRAPEFGSFGWLISWVKSSRIT